jgi:hypothetical protein
VADGTHNRLRDIFYESLGRENMNLLWQLKETLNQLPAKRLLDVGAGMRVSKNICLQGGVESAVVIDPDGGTLRGLAAYYHDARIEVVQEKIEAARLEYAAFDLALFIMSLLWTDDPAAALQKVVSRSPAHQIGWALNLTEAPIGNGRGLAVFREDFQACAAAATFGRLSGRPG